jgi:hypothetical protein
LGGGEDADGSIFEVIKCKVLEYPINDAGFETAPLEVINGVGAVHGGLQLKTSHGFTPVTSMAGDGELPALKLGL